MKTEEISRENATSKCALLSFDEKFQSFVFVVFLLLGHYLSLLLKEVYLKKCAKYVPLVTLKTKVQNIADYYAWNSN